jgi:hypothetical protein
MEIRWALQNSAMENASNNGGAALFWRGSASAMEVETTELPPIRRFGRGGCANGVAGWGMVRPQGTMLRPMWCCGRLWIRWPRPRFLILSRPPYRSTLHQILGFESRSRRPKLRRPTGSGVSSLSTGWAAARTNLISGPFGVPILVPNNF